MRKLKNGMVALAGLAAFGVAQASNWVPLSITSRNGSNHFSIDAQSIKNGPNGVVSAWFEMRTDSTSVPWDTRKYMVRFNCRTKHESIGPGAWYKNGQVIQSDSDFLPEQEIIPDSVADGQFELLCTKRNP